MRRGRPGADAGRWWRRRTPPPPGPPVRRRPAARPTALRTGSSAAPVGIWRRRDDSSDGSSVANGARGVSKGSRNDETCRHYDPPRDGRTGERAAMSYALGVDIGTTFSAAAVHRQGRAEMVALGYRSALVPSAVLINAEGGTLVGDAALRRGRSEPERLARFFKRRIGDSVPLIVGGSPFSAEQLTARLLRAVVDGVAEQQGGAPDAVYDLGSGTFDATLLRRAGDRFEVIGEPEGIERLGGIDFDAAVFEHVRRSLDGAIESLAEDDPNTIRAIARLRDDCIDAKEALSSDTQVSIPVVLPKLATEIRLTRSELEGMIRPVLDDSIASLRRAVASADVTAAQV